MGDVYTLWFGPQATVHICSMDLAHETMIKRGNEFADRWNPSLFDEIIGQALKYFDSKVTVVLQAIKR